MTSRGWKRYAELAARLRVPSGFLLVVVYAWFARPTPRLFASGVLVAGVGIALRAWAAGHLEKNQRLATSGPYAFTRNPLYIGSTLGALGFALAGGVWWLGLLFALYMAAVYLAVVSEEESHLRSLFPEFHDYAARVPRFVPRLRGVRGGNAERTLQGGNAGRFRASLYWKNEEYNALLGYLFGVVLLLWKLKR